MHKIVAVTSWGSFKELCGFTTRPENQWKLPMLQQNC